MTRDQPPMHPDSPRHGSETSPVTERLTLRDQYRSCIRVLNETGVAQRSLTHPGLVTTGLDPDHPTALREYPIPEEHDLLQSMEQTPWLAEKVEQGFAELSIVSVAVPLPILMERVKQELLKHHKDKTLRSSDGTVLDLETTTPLYAWDSIMDTDLVYDPKAFSPNHQGLSKAQFLKTLSFPGYDVLLMEPTEIPEEGHGTTLSGRKQLEANHTPMEYLSTLFTNPAYAHEVGLFPEAWLTRLLQRLHTKNEVIDDYSGTGKFCYLIGSFHSASGDVPDAVWGRGSRRAYLGWREPGGCSVNRGSRSAVRIKKIGD